MVGSEVVDDLVETAGNEVNKLHFHHHGFALKAHSDGGANDGGFADGGVNYALRAVLLLETFGDAECTAKQAQPSQSRFRRGTRDTQVVVSATRRNSGDGCAVAINNGALDGLPLGSDEGLPDGLSLGLQLG